MVLQVDKHASLQAHNGMAVPAIASDLVAVKTVAEVIDAIEYAEGAGLPIIVLGEGSNTLFKQNVSALVVLNRICGIELLSEDEQHAVVKVSAGENWHEFVQYALQQEWYGLENLALIPGLVGAAPIQNIGAYGVEVQSVLLEVEFISINDKTTHVLSNTQCEFGYRDSIFKRALRDKTIITAVTFRLHKEARCNTDYPVLAKAVGIPADPHKVFAAVCNIRSQKLPLPEAIPNTGSFFKNPVVGVQQHEALIGQYPQLVSFKVDQGYKLAAGWLIEQAGWKKRAEEGVCVHQDQALVITNPEHRSGRAVMRYAQQIQQDIEQRFGVFLEIEPRVY